MDHAEFPLGVLVLLLFWKCIYTFVAHHNKYCCGYHSKQLEQTKFILQNLKRRESLDRHSGNIQKKYATRLPDVVVVLILRVFLFPVKRYRP